MFNHFTIIRWFFQGRHMTDMEPLGYVFNPLAWNSRAAPRSGRPRPISVAPTWRPAWWPQEGGAVQQDAGFDHGVVPGRCLREVWMWLETLGMNSPSKLELYTFYIV